MFLYIKSPSIYLSVRLCLSSVCLSVYLSVCLSVCPSACLSVFLSVSVSVHPSVRLSVCLLVRLIAYYQQSVGICRQSTQISIPRSEPVGHFRSFCPVTCSSSSALRRSPARPYARRCGLSTRQLSMHILGDDTKCTKHPIWCVESLWWSAPAVRRVGSLRGWRTAARSTGPWRSHRARQGQLRMTRR